MAWNNGNDAALRARAARVIPRGMYGHQSTLLLPEGYPQFFRRARGARLWDADDNEYVDMMCAYGPNLLGYGFAPVEQAVAAQQALGDTMTGPSEIMVELAETMVGMVTHAQWAMFCKNGTDATTLAVTVARAQTRRHRILAARGAYHGAAPWCTPRLDGVNAEDRANVTYFTYNDANSLEEALRAHAGDVAGVIVTPFVHDMFKPQVDAAPEFARAARRLCDAHGALLIVDDVRAGFRLARDGSWSALGVQPDLSAWGKCIGNGQPISALLGSDTARTGAERIYATGSFWFSAVPMAAAIATLRHLREGDYLERIVAAGTRLRAGLAQQAAAHGFDLQQTGPVQMPQLLFAEDPDLRLGYAWAAEALKHGAYLHPSHNNFLSAAHTDADIDHVLRATDAAFEFVRRNIDRLAPQPIVAAMLSPH